MFVLTLICALDLQRKEYKYTQQGIFEHKLLDGDKIIVDSNKESSVYLCVQPHTFIGELTANVTWWDDTQSFFKVNESDLLQINCKSITILYASRGGVSLSVWHIPAKTCQDKVIYSANQRSVDISIAKNFEAKQHICWFLSFVREPELTANIQKLEGNAKLEILNSNNEHTLNIGSFQNKTFHQEKKSVVVFDSQEGGFVNASIFAKSPIPYADWTDTYRFFKRLTKDGAINLVPSDSEVFLTADRNVEPWIWTIFFSIGGAIFFFTVILFFVRPVKKMRRSLSLADIAKDIKQD